MLISRHWFLKEIFDYAQASHQADYTDVFGQSLAPQTKPFICAVSFPTTAIFTIAELVAEFDGNGLVFGVKILILFNAWAYCLLFFVQLSDQGVFEIVVTENLGKEGAD